jgi:hypothetical protein
VVVVCEGQKTEPSYLRLVNAKSATALVELEIVDEAATAPKSLVEVACASMRASRREARRTRDPNANIDEIWCAFDVDQHPMLREAKQQAGDNGIRLAISNPSIELWFLLHFTDQTAYVHRAAAMRALRDYVPDYDKHFGTLSPLEGRYKIARTRALQLAKKHDGDGTTFPDDNPSSNVWELVDSLDANY